MDPANEPSEPSERPRIDLSPRGPKKRKRGKTDAEQDSGADVGGGGRKRRIDIGAGGPGMDVRRTPAGKRKRNLWIGAGVLALIALTFFISQLEPAAPSVDRDIQLFGTVERGSFVREVRGSGTLVPEQIVYVAALTGGRVEQVLKQPGETVEPTDVLVVLSNPDVELEALEAQRNLTSARANLQDLELTLRQGILQQEASVAQSEADYQNAQREADQLAELVENGTVSRNEASRAIEAARAARVRLDTERSRLDLMRSSMEGQLEIQRDQVQRLASIVEYREGRVASMQVAAQASGILQDMSLEIGQFVQSGTTLARVAQPGRLKAEIRIPETQARDVSIGQPVVIDTRTDSVAGAVRRVDPNVQNGSVLVEVRITEELPPGARPDLSVDGTIELERLEDVLYVDRPAYAQTNGTVSVFRLTENGNEAVRITVRLGRSSVNEIEVLEGLEEGDVIILSDLSRIQDADRIRIR